MTQLHISIQTADIEFGDDEDQHVKLPAEYVICSQCRGTGGHSLRFGAITQSDRDEHWDEDSFADYMAGRYDEPCERCDGTGKVLVINRDAIERSRREDWKAALKKHDKDEDDEADYQAERESELRMGC